MFQITQAHFTLDQLSELIQSNEQLQLSKETAESVENCRTVLDEMIKESKEPIYGINTGFGSLHNRSISNENLGQLQRNLVMSHACGMGEQVPNEVVKWMLLLKILGISKGHSGVQLATVNRLIDFYNNGIYPKIYQQGSLGASGDLSPLAHLSLPLLGEGSVMFEGKEVDSKEILKKFNWQPIELQSKEGLALLNGTQFMSAYGAYLLNKSVGLFDWANHIAAISLEAYNGRSNPFKENVNAIRNQKGQIKVAEVIRELLQNSELQEQHKPHVQDPYSFRCVPQVHGASSDALDFIVGVVQREVNAVTDNPTIFPETREVISAGNFHGQPLALVLDQLSIAMAEIGSISERRIYKLIGGKRDLPEFLVNNPGLDSGFMIPQYTAASIVSQNKQLCMPASVDSIDSSTRPRGSCEHGRKCSNKSLSCG